MSCEPKRVRVLILWTSGGTWCYKITTLRHVEITSMYGNTSTQCCKVHQVLAYIQGFVFRKLDDVLFINGTTVRSLKVSSTMGELRRRWDSSTVILRCENRHFILSAIL